MRLGTWIGVLAAVTIVVSGCAERPGTTLTAREATPRPPTSLSTGSDDDDATTSSTSPAIEWVSVESPASMNGQTTNGGELRVERLPGFSELAIRGQVLRLGPADYLVPESTLVAFNGSRALLARETSAPISTPIVVRVHEVLAARTNSAIDVVIGDQLTVWVSGGLVEFTVSPEDAERTGLRPDIGHEEEQSDIDSGREPPRGPGPVPTEPFQTGYSSPEFVSFTEGQEVIAFLRWADWYDPVANDGTYYEDRRLLLGLDDTGVGLFVRDLDGSALEPGPFVHAATSAAIAEGDLLDAADGISELTGRASSPGWLGSDLYNSS